MIWDAEQPGSDCSASDLSDIYVSLLPAKLSIGRSNGLKEMGVSGYEHLGRCA